MYRLLIVDDMPIVADGLEGLLRGAVHLNVELYKACSGSTALDILRSKRIDIVLSDIKMPGMEGIDLLKEIRLHWPHCKVVFLTAYDDFEYVRSAMSLGGFEYILKVEDDRKIIRTIERAINSLNEENVARSLIQQAYRELLDADGGGAMRDVPFGSEAVRGTLRELGLAAERKQAGSTEPIAEETSGQAGKAYFQLHKVRLLGDYLESGREAEFDKLFDELSTFLLGDETGYMHKLECLHALNVVYVPSLAACGLQNELTLLRALYKRIQSGEESSWRTIEGRFRDLASSIFECKRSAMNVNAHDFIDKVHAYIETHLADDLSLATLAAHVNFNPSYFSRFYKQTTGEALSDYIADIRNAKAKELLQRPAMKIQDIAEKTGYHSSMAFIRFFKKQNGITPEEYRRRSLIGSRRKEYNAGVGERRS
ncbi:response regulator [Paenibacillus donghaensis]|uniref:response regulator n=1 Tax=Paenibacillus donghaensis TaxID=414771 RepID=UPI0018838364|nr:response regulator [Paenibacillus donghaensis]MBE9915915.1 response regulator [Paenibacillus donghaensis]